METDLERRSKAKGRLFFENYNHLKGQLLSGEYLFVLHRFEGGNDHGPEHIQRVLEYLDRLLGEHAKDLSDLELYLLLCAVLLHDQGLLLGRQDHPRASQRLIRLPEYRNYFEKIEAEYLGRIVAAHSGAGEIEREFKGYKDRESVGGCLIRPRYLASLLRLADELDEDYRRAKWRIFDKIFLPEDSLIYWLVNLTIASVEPSPSEGVIRVTCEYANGDLADTYQLGRVRVSILAGVFRKMQKLNRERKYCMTFVEEGPRFKEVRIRFHNTDTGEGIEAQLSDTEDGESFFREHYRLFHEEQPAAVPKPAEDYLSVGDMSLATTSKGARQWRDLTDVERMSARIRHDDFISDALEVVERPDLFGKWQLSLSGPLDDVQVTLETRVLVHPEADDPVCVRVYPVGEYPLSYPRIDITETGDFTANARNLVRSKSWEVEASWPSQYRGLRNGRLFHVADAVSGLQVPVACFRHDAAAAIASVGASCWSLEAKKGELPRLHWTIDIKGQRHNVVVEPGNGYPLRKPVVRCLPVLGSVHWLGDGQLNWYCLDSGLAAVEDGWKKMLLCENPLSQLMLKLEGLMQGHV
jgi:hypothetical protein